MRVFLSLILVNHCRIPELFRQVDQQPRMIAGARHIIAAGQRVVDLTELVVVVWDGEVARGVGGTADIVDYAKAKGRELLIVWPDNVVR